MVDIRSILNARIDPALVAWPDDTDFVPPEQTGEQSTRVRWYDVDWNSAGKLNTEAYQQICFGDVRAIEGKLEVAICEEAIRGADARARAEAELLEADFTGKNTATMVYRYQESDIESQFVWQGVWYRSEWTIPIERYEDGTATAVSANQITVTQVAHGFNNDWVGKSGGSYVKAGADEATGFATSISANQALITLSGPMTWTSHGLADGSAIYLHVSTDGGSQTATPGVGDRYQRVGYVLDANTIVVRPEPKQGV